MAFWGSSRLKRELHSANVITSASGETPSDSIVVNGAFELSLGPEAFLTSDENGKKQIIEHQVAIPPGQFGILLSEETVSIPNNALGFISIKASIKFRGLVNVSGFHVDSGFHGRLKFAVYNAGSQNVVLSRSDRVFLLWLCDIDQTTEPYSGTHANQNSISSEDVMRIQGEVASPAQLKKDIKTCEQKLEKEVQRLEHKFSNLKTFLTTVTATLLTLLAGILIFQLRSCVPPARAADVQVTNSPAEINATPDVATKKPSVGEGQSEPNAQLVATNLVSPSNYSTRGGTTNESATTGPARPE